MRTHQKAFTLVELMVVVAIISVISVLAVKSFRKSRSQLDVDAWATILHNQMNAASRRSVATQQPYLVDLRPTSVRYCQVTLFSGGPPWTTSQTTCPSPIPANMDAGPLAGATEDAQIAFYAASTDASVPGGTYAAPAKSTIGGGTYFYVGKYSTASHLFDNVMTPSLPLPGAIGFTVYLRRQGNDETDKRRRVVVYGASAKARVVNNY